jgi:diguanylate cyclase
MCKKLNMGSKNFAIIVISICASLSVFPFICMRIINEQYEIALIDSIIFISSFFVAIYAYKAKHTNENLGKVMTLFCALISGILIISYGQNMVYWFFPMMIVTYFMTNPKPTVILNTLVIIAISPSLYSIVDFIKFLTLMITLFVSNIFIFFFAQMNAFQKKEMYNLAWFDSLTGIRNRRSLDRSFEEIRINRNKVSIITIDIDNFKLINDRYGHSFGDSVLIKMSNSIKDRVRFTDKIYRYGGEEFVLISLNTDMENAKRIAEELRIIVEEIKFEKELRITISLGVSELKDGEDPIDCFNRSDKALYKAKNTGKNKFCFS